MNSPLGSCCPAEHLRLSYNTGSRARVHQKERDRTRKVMRALRAGYKVDISHIGGLFWAHALMLGKFPTLGVLFFPDGSPKTCVGSLWCGVHWSGASGRDSEWQVTNTRKEYAQPSVFHERIPEASVWLWAIAGLQGCVPSYSS